MFRSSIRWLLFFTARVMASALLLVGLLWSVFLWIYGSDPWWTAGLSQIAVALAADWWLVKVGGPLEDLL